MDAIERGDFVQINKVDEYPHSYDAYMLLERIIEIQAVGVVKVIHPAYMRDETRVQLIEVEFPDPYGYMGDSDIPGVECFFFEQVELEIADVVLLSF